MQQNSSGQFKLTAQHQTTSMMQSSTSFQIQGCVLCGHDRPRCMSHIIPKAYFKGMKRSNRGMLVEFDDRDDSPVDRKSKESLSEPMLCSACESRLNLLETPSIEYLRKAAKVARTKPYCLPAKAIPVIERFLVSVLWRAGVSVQPFYGEVEIPSNELEAIRLWLVAEGEPRQRNQIGIRIRKIIDRSGKITAVRFDQITVSPWHSVSPSRLKTSMSVSF